MNARNEATAMPGEPWSWLGREGGLVIELHAVAGVAVLSIGGRLDRCAAPKCRAALERAVAPGRTGVVVDLGLALVGPESTALLALMMRWADRHGVAMRFTRAPQELVAALDDALGASYHHDSPVDAIRAVGAGRAVFAT